MKFLHCIHGLAPTSGGPMEYLRQLAKLHHQYGNTMEVATLDRPGDAWISAFPAPVHALGPGFLKYGYAPRFLRWLKRYREDFDLVVVNGIWQFSSFATWLALRESRVPYVVYTHGMLDPWFRRAYPLKHVKKLLYWPWAEYRVLKDARAILFTSEEERRRAHASFHPFDGEKIVVPYGTTSPEHSLDSSKRVFFERVPQLRGKRFILFLGRIHEMKGCDLLLTAFARVAPRFPNVQLALAGPCANDYASLLQKRFAADNPGLADRVTWLDMLSGELKWGALAAAEAFILPSHRENFGIAVAEALACGVPVLVSDQVNIYREIKEYGAGIVAPDDLNGTTSLLEGWFSMPAQDKPIMAERARRCFTEQFDLCRSFPALLEILRQCASPNQSRGVCD